MDAQEAITSTMADGCIAKNATQLEGMHGTAASKYPGDNTGPPTFYGDLMTNLTDNNSISDTTLLAVNRVSDDDQERMIAFARDYDDDRLFEIQQAIRKKFNWDAFICRSCGMTFYPKDIRAQYCHNSCKKNVSYK